MSLPKASSWWRDELQSADRSADRHREELVERVERYHGPGFRRDRSGLEEFDPENHAFEFVALMMPQAAAAEPRIRARTSWQGEPQTLARALGYTMNRWCRVTKLVDLQEEMFVDYAFGMMVGWVGVEPRPGMLGFDDPPYMPAMTRIPIERFGWDPGATSKSEIRYLYHKEIADKEDLLERAEKEEGWIKENIVKLADDAGVDELRGRSQNGAQDVQSRREVVFYRCWVPEWEVEGYSSEDGYHGAIVTLGLVNELEGSEDEDEIIDFDEEGRPVRTKGKGKALWIKEPEPYFGPRDGPYFFGGAYPVPGYVYPLAPVPAVKEQADQLNAHVRSMIQSMLDYKQMVLVSDEDPDLQETIRDGSHHFVYPVSIDEIRNKVVNLVVGGVTEQQFAWAADARARLDRNSGIHEIQRGNIDGAGTATEASLAVNAANVRSGHHVHKFRRLMEEGLKKVAWYFWWDERVKMEMGHEAAGVFVDMDSGSFIKRPMWVGGPRLPEGASPRDKEALKRDLAVQWEALDIQIELYSMSRTSEQRQALLMQVVQETMAEVAVMVEQHPWVRVEEYVEWKADTLGLPELPRFFDYEKGRMFGQVLMQLQTQVQPSSPDQPSSPQARTRTDTEALGMNGRSGGPRVGPGASRAEAPSRILSRGQGGAGGPVEGGGTSLGPIQGSATPRPPKASTGRL